MAFTRMYGAKAYAQGHPERSCPPSGHALRVCGSPTGNDRLHSMSVAPHFMSRSLMPAVPPKILPEPPCAAFPFASKDPTSVPLVGGNVSRVQTNNQRKGLIMTTATLEQKQASTATTEKAQCLHSWRVKLYTGKEKCMHCGRIETRETFENEKMLIIASL
jgi:hypothetical protein